MTTGSRQWPVRSAAAAEQDLRQILAWTFANFGEVQARTYAETLSAAIQSLTDGPTTVGARERPDIGKGICALHAARHGSKGRHFVMYRVAKYRDQNVIDVLRVLHDTTDFTRHLPAED